MVNSKTIKTNIIYNKKSEKEDPDPASYKNLISSKQEKQDKTFNSAALIEKFDKEIMDILSSIKEMVNFHPKTINLPYSFKIQEINGERFFDESGKLMIIREYENDSIREYYPSDDGIYVNTIIETDKNTGAIISKIKPTIISDTEIKFNIIIFDPQINHKYTMYQVESNGIISSITDIFEKGSNFRTILKNKQTSSPEKYMESKENEEGELELVECKLNPLIQEIKYTTASKKISIRFEDGHKVIDIIRQKA